MFLTVWMLLVGSAAAGSLPKQYGVCPYGWTTYGDVCLTDQTSSLVPKQYGVCPYPWTDYGSYCYVMEPWSVVRKQDGVCPYSWSDYGDYCLQSHAAPPTYGPADEPPDAPVYADTPEASSNDQGADAEMRNKMASIVSRPGFQEYAAGLGYHVGTASQNPDGSWNYIPGRDDWTVVRRWARESRGQPVQTRPTTAAPAMGRTDGSAGPSSRASGNDFVSPSLGTMKWIPAGTFTMGSTRAPDETPHQVVVSKGYWLMEHEVTQGEYQAVMGTNPTESAACGANCPVQQVSWEDAVAFAQAASARDGVAYRLPTEAEWERAARGEGSAVFAGSDLAGEVAWTSENSDGTSHAVCAKRLNDYGLCDMSGNAAEWVSDWYGPYPGSVTDPAGPASGRFRVQRGGAWFGYVDSATVSSRSRGVPDLSLLPVGLRLARSSP